LVFFQVLEVSQEDLEVEEEAVASTLPPSNVVIKVHALRIQLETHMLPQIHVAPHFHLFTFSFFLPLF